MYNEILAEKVKEYMERTKTTKAKLSEVLGVNRASVVQYLNGKHEEMAQGTINKIEEAIEQLIVSDEEDGESEQTEKQAPVKRKKRSAIVQTADAGGVMAVCQSSQDYMGLGVITGRSGFGKSYSLKYYAKSPRCAYVECNESMNARDLVKAIEKALSLPHISGSIDDRLDNIKDFFNMNDGYLLIIDEADKLITKYTQKKAEILRNIYDQSDMGLVLAGEMTLAKMIRQYIPRLANRIDFSYTLGGLEESEVLEYISGGGFDEAAEAELVRRATNEKTGCFRLLNRTYENVMRLADGSDNVITADMVREASAMMLL